MRSRHAPPLRAMMALAVIVAAGPLGAQTSPTQPPQGTKETQQTLEVQVQLVRLFATVRGKHNALVPNLTKDGFRVFENGQEQKIAYFERESKLPLTLGLLVDTSGSEQRMLGAEQEAATRFLHRVLRKGDEAMVISFDIDVDLLSDFTEDFARLERAVHRTQINAPMTPATVQGPLPQTTPKGTDFYDAIYLACNDKLAREAGHKALVILTDAEDFGSKVKLADAIEAAQRTDTVVHILHIADPRQTFGFGAGVARKISEETGGRVIEVSSEKKLEEAFDQISEELRSQYVIGYYPSNSARDGTFRKIKVETVPGGLHVLTRKGYYAPKN